MNISSCAECPMLQEDYFNGYYCGHPEFFSLDETTEIMLEVLDTIYYNCPLLLRDLEIKGSKISMEKFASYLMDRGWKKRVTEYSPSNGNYYVKNKEFVFLPTKHDEFTHSRLMKAIDRVIQIEKLDSSVLMKNILCDILIR